VHAEHKTKQTDNISDEWRHKQFVCIAILLIAVAFG
jgi:hypothetical protein